MIQSDKRNRPEGQTGTLMLQFDEDTRQAKNPPKEPVHILAQEEGIYLKISPTEIRKLKANQVKSLKQKATPLIYISEDFTEKAESHRVELFEEAPDGTLFLPKGLLSAYQKLVPQLKFLPGLNGESLPLTKSILPLLQLSLKSGAENLQIDPNQIKVLEEIFARKAGGLIQVPMGGGKAMITCAITYGLPLLRPAAVSGKGTRDVLQLLDWLTAFGEKNPERKEKIILSGCGKTPTKKDMAHIENGEGIFLCTHAGLQNLPENVQLLVMDEVHASGTPKRMAHVFKRPKLRRIYGLSGTIGLRADGGDQLLEALCGPVFTSSTHEEFEKTKRVAPTEIHVYNFHGTGEYLPNPADPTEEPEEGYGLQQTWVENHRGRTHFTADLALYLPQTEIKVIFTPHVLHAVRIQKAIIHEAKKQGIVFEDGSEPVLIHSSTEKKGGRLKKEHLMSKEERDVKVRLLKHGILKLVICTDFLSTGVDTNMIDHIIDASGQKALITSIQRSGRGTRPRILEDGSEKINKLHIILDRTRTLLRVLGEQKILELRRYYGHLPGEETPARKGGYFLHTQPPWRPDAGLIDYAMAMPPSPH